MPRKMPEVNLWPPYTFTHMNIHKKMIGSCLRTQTTPCTSITDHDITFKPNLLLLGIITYDSKPIFGNLTFLKYKNL